jgi:hypothetical protein
MKPIEVVAYEAYCAKAGSKSMVTGNFLPSWGELPESVKECWLYVARTVIIEFLYNKS